MTLEETYRAGRRELMEAGIESPAFDAVCIFEKYFGLDRQGLILRGREEAGEEASHAFFGSIRERAAGRPLQYILGVWPFLDMELAVGEGVLAPREETELLVREGAARLRRELPGAGDGEGLLIADLCSGSGAVALGLAGEFPAASVRAVERFPAAYSYLTENIRRTGRRVTPLSLDVLRPESADAFSGLSLLAANPPYVTCEEIDGLQRELHHEPRSALDGGGDGLVFYRAIAAHWIPCLAPGGVCAVEIGENQAAAVSGLFAQAGLTRIEVTKDFNGFDRVVTGRAGKN